MGENEVPSLEEQKEIAKRCREKELKKGDTWYIVDYRWFKSFSRFVGLEDSTDICSVGADHPGPIDNSSLYPDGETDKIKESLDEEIDYVLVPEELWNYLVLWYGTSDERPIPRQVVDTGVFTKHCKVEVYFMELKLYKDFNYSREIRRAFSKSDTIGDIEKVMRKEFNIPDDKSTRLLAVFNPHKFEILNKENTILDAGLFVNQTIMIETRNPGSEFVQTLHPPRSLGSLVSSSASSTITSTNSDSEEMLISTTSIDTSPNTSRSSSATTLQWVDNPSVIGTRGRLGSDIAAIAGPSTSIMSTRYAYGNDTRMNQNTEPGLCGLCNLGNTCFMNSVLQCMSNSPPITKYFLENKHLGDINKVNPLGTKGEIAYAFADLIKVMWSGKHVYTVPHNFKLQVSRFAPQFLGYYQHDSQELLTFLLDGLHEDLNRVREKPYIEKRDSDGSNDRECAKEAWENYLKRNDSIIVDVFHGLLKSTVVCPECAKVSVTFDPFCYLPVPLPLKRERYIEVTFIPYDHSKRLIKYRVCVPKKGIVQDITSSLSALIGIRPEHMLVTEVSVCHFHKFFSPNDSLECIEDKDNDIYVYEYPLLNENYIAVPVCMWECKQDLGFKISQLFGIPLIIGVPRDNCSYDVLYEAISTKLARFITLPSDDNIWLLNTNLSNEEECITPYDNVSTNSGNYSDSSSSSMEPSKYLFSMYVVNASTTEINPLHEDANALNIPNILGRQYIALKWQSTVRNQIFNDDTFSDIDKHDSMKQKRSLLKIKLYDCLDLYTMSETLGAEDAWYCPSCKKHQRATKKFDLWSLPQILIIHLKRFSYNKFRREKIDTHVDFPLTELNMISYVVNDEHPPAVYDLIGICNHFGGMGGGHYTAFCKNDILKAWHCYDDQTVTPIKEENVVSSAAYVLFYMKRRQEGDEMDGIEPFLPFE